MATGRHIALSAGAALLAAAAVLGSSIPARAQSCDLQDISNDLSNAWSGVPSCEAAGASGVGCFAAFAIVAGLAAADAANQQSGVASFCTDVQNAAYDVTAIPGDLQKIGVPQSVVDNVSSALGSVADPLAAAQCACDEVQGLGSALDAIGNCIQAGLCDVSAFFGGSCGCTQTTEQVSCPPVLAGCNGLFYQNQLTGCYDQNSPNYNSLACLCDRAPLATGYASPPIVQINTPGGTEIIQGDLSCGDSWACFCPTPMTLQHTCDAVRDFYCSNDVYYCACPDGTNPDPSGKMACVCPNGQPANFAQNSFLPTCGCPTGQINWNGKCVPACAKNDVRTPDGTCCDLNQVSSCGQCCPDGMTPDPANGTCYPPGKIQ